jgi:probable rRNA maturation factor
MSVEVINRQRRYVTDRERLAAVAASTLAAVGRDGAEVTVTLSNDRRLRALNRLYRSKDKATDVLSFPYDEPDGPLGDVIISVDRAHAQATERGHSLQHELELLTLHGTLHVCGYDHETDDGEMERIERRLRKRFVTS